LTEEICKLCKGTGWIVSIKNQQQFARKCDCQKADQFINKLENTNIPRRFMGFELKAYLPADNNQSQKDAKKKIKKFIDDFPAVSKGFLLKGHTGVGKTRLLCSVTTELLKKIPELNMYYIDWNDLVREMRSGEDASNRDFNSISQLMEKLVSIDLLLFDELGATNLSPWVADNIYYIFNKRYNNGKITLCATNYFDTVQANGETLMQRIGNRIRSRLYEMTDDIEIQGIDYRERWH
jgi:DNA replication protein DnaC